MKTTDIDFRLIDSLLKELPPLPKEFHSGYPIEGYPGMVYLGSVWSTAFGTIPYESRFAYQLVVGQDGKAIHRRGGSRIRRSLCPCLCIEDRA